MRDVERKTSFCYDDQLKIKSTITTDFPITKYYCFTQLGKNVPFFYEDKILIYISQS